MIDLKKYIIWPTRFCFGPLYKSQQFAAQDLCKPHVPLDVFIDWLKEEDTNDKLKLIEILSDLESESENFKLESEIEEETEDTCDCVGFDHRFNCPEYTIPY